VEVRGGIPRIILSNNTFPTWGGSIFFPQGCSLQARARAEKKAVYRGDVCVVEVSAFLVSGARFWK
jgi:hypothetical protein